MHQIRFRLGLCPTDPAGGTYSVPSDTLAGFKGPTSNGREGLEAEGEGYDKDDVRRGKGQGERRGGDGGERKRGKGEEGSFPGSSDSLPDVGMLE